jgi:hypothetical protein
MIDGAEVAAVVAMVKFMDSNVVLAVQQWEEDEVQNHAELLSYLEKRLAIFTNRINL